MKKIFKVFSVIFLSVFLFGFFGIEYSFASGNAGTKNICESCTKDSECIGVSVLCTAEKQCLDPNQVSFCPLSEHTDASALVNKISGEILILALVIAPLFILLGGFYMVTAAGEPKRSTKGKTIITWALIGLAVILTAKAFISVITSVLK